MNVYSELLELLSPPLPASVPGLMGTVESISPLTVTVRGAAVSEGLARPSGMTFAQEDVGKTVALLPWEGGYLILCFVEGDGL